MLLNLGHTFGHALEAWAGFSDRLLHGEAIAIGICLAFRFSEELGLIGNNSVARVETHFVAARPADAHRRHSRRRSSPTRQRCWRSWARTRRCAQGKLTLILVRGIGEAFITRDVASDTVRDFLARQIDR